MLAWDSFNSLFYAFTFDKVSDDEINNGDDDNDIHNSRICMNTIH